MKDDVAELHYVMLGISYEKHFYVMLPHFFL